MFPLRTLVILLCFQRGGLCNAIHVVEMVTLQVEFGESAILPCNGSAYLEEEGSVQWEVMGEDVAILQGGELRQGDKFKGRVQLPSEEKLREGDWSVVLLHTMLSDTDMFECILQGRKTISTVWLTVMAPPVERSLVVPVGDTVDLACYVQISRSQSINDLQVWWTRNGSTIVSTHSELFPPGIVVSNSDDILRIDLLGDTKGEFHLYMSPTMMSDNGEYHCLYKTRYSDHPRPGIPESITLTMLETNSTDIGFLPDETITATEDWDSMSHWLVTPWTEEVTAETTQSPLDLIPVLLEDSTQQIQVMTESQPMEAVGETVASFPEEGFLPDETITATEDWDSMSHWLVTPWTEEVTAKTTQSPLDLIPVLLEDSTQQIQVMTESQPMEAVGETVASFPEEGFLPDETITATGTEDWDSMSHWLVTPWTEEVTAETTQSPLDLIPVLLEDSTQQIQVMTESQPMEAVEETVASFPEEGFLPDETITATGTEDWDSMSHWLVTPWTEEVTAETTQSPLDLIPVLLEDSTQQIQVMTESQPMEAVGETVASFPEEGFLPDETITATGTEDWDSMSHWLVTPWTEEVTAETTQSPLDLIPVLLEDSTQQIQGTLETSTDSLQWDTFPWIRIGLIAGVLVVTAVVLCILGALQKI